MMTHPLWLAQNLMAVTHPPFALTHPPPLYLLTSPLDMRSTTCQAMHVCWVDLFPVKPYHSI